MQENLWPVVAATTLNAVLKPKPIGVLYDPPDVEDVAADRKNEPAVLGAAVPLKLIHIPSVVSKFMICKPRRVVEATTAFCAVPPVVIVLEQFTGVTFTAPCTACGELPGVVVTGNGVVDETG